jgi:hypothetical protein
LDIIDRLKVLRSKNAGPFVVTFDVVFGQTEDYEVLKKQLSTDKIATAFQVAEADVLGFDFFDELSAAKMSIKRRLPCGHPGDPDCYGMNQEEPLAMLLRQLVSN